MPVPRATLRYKNVCPFRSARGYPSPCFVLSPMAIRRSPSTGGVIPRHASFFLFTVGRGPVPRHSNDRGGQAPALRKNGPLPRRARACPSPCRVRQVVCHNFEQMSNHGQIWRLGLRIKPINPTHHRCSPCNHLRLQILHEIKFLSFARRSDRVIGTRGPSYVTRKTRCVFLHLRAYKARLRAAFAPTGIPISFASSGTESTPRNPSYTPHTR